MESRRKKQKFFKGFLVGPLLLLLLICFFLIPNLAFGNNKNSESQVIVVLIDKTTWGDLAKANASFLDQLLEGSAIGLMSHRTLYPSTTTPSSYLTISAGNRGTAAAEAGLAFNRNESFQEKSAKDVFKRFTGYDTEGFAILHLGLPILQRKNQDTGYDVKPGALGEALQKAGLETAVLGNADTSIASSNGSYFREAAILAMNEKGQINLGDVSKALLKEDSDSPYGVRTDYNKLLERFTQIKAQSALVIIDLGDTRRADLFQKEASFEVTKKYKRVAIRRADNFLEKLFKQIDPKHTLLVIASPSPPSEFNQTGQKLQPSQNLTPIILVGKDTDPGLLASDSTRRAGLVLSTDIAPTIMKSLDISLPYFLTGSPINIEKANKTAGSKNLVSDLIKENKNYVFTKVITTPVIIFFVIFLAAVFLFALFLLIITTPISKRLYLLSSNLLLATIAFPLVLFVLPFFVSTNPSLETFLGWGVGLIFGFVTISQLFPNKKFHPFIFLVVATTAVIGLDLFFDSQANMNSILGYSPIVAGRFYGLGNQAMSILITTTLLGSTLWLESKNNLSSWDKVLLLALFIFVTFLIGFPRLGANTGGTITAVVTFSVTYLYLVGKNIKLKHLLAITIATVLVLTLFVLGDVFFLSASTHLGRSARLIYQGGFDEVKQIAERKVEANIRILKYTSWSYLLLLIILMLLFLHFFQPNGFFRQFLLRYHYLAVGLTGALIGGIVGLLVNDSGVSIPALILSYFLSVIFYLMIQERYVSLSS